MIKDDRLDRLDDCRWRVRNPMNLDATLFANSDVPVESSAIDELLGVLELQRSIEQLADSAPGFFGAPPAIRKVAVTPDFHKGAGIPIGTVLATHGFVIPAAIGNDINCGMRLHTTTLNADRIAGKLDALETRFRRQFFEGGRDIPMTRVQREALLRDGIDGLLATVPAAQSRGLWSSFHRWVPRDVARIERRGSLRATETHGLADFLGPVELSRDSQIGSIGGGNHFVEIQRVERIFDRGAAYAWGLKPGQLTVMVHTGSVSVGHRGAGIVRDLVRALHPAGVKHPPNGIHVLPENEHAGSTAERFWNCLHNAANFAFANRMFLALMAMEGLAAECGELDASLIYDAPHNLVWREEFDGEPVYIHRKGACPARGLEAMAGTPFEFHGEPVMVPGSMGASSFLLAGCGNRESLWSASHGAGRALSRGDALKGDDVLFADFMKRFRVVTPVDFRRQDVRQRPDILAKKLEDIKKEAPFAYKGIGPVVKTLEAAGIARPVAELTPLMTIKG